jgi:hypothetical protein
MNGAAAQATGERVESADCGEGLPPRRRSRRRWLIAAVLLVAVALLAAACTHSSSGPGVAKVGSSTGSGGAPRAGGSTSSPSAVAYSACMRSHGVSNFPDPGSDGQVPKGDAQQFGVSSSQFRAAQRACQHLYPSNGGSDCMLTNTCTQAVVQQLLTADRKLAECMRSHGWPTFPDPTNGGSGGPWFNITKAGISDGESHTHQFVAKLDQCSRLVGGNAPESFG